MVDFQIWWTSANAGRTSRQFITLSSSLLPSIVDEHTFPIRRRRTHARNDPSTYPPSATMRPERGKDGSDKTNPWSQHNNTNNIWAGSRWDKDTEEIRGKGNGLLGELRGQGMDG